MLRRNKRLRLNLESLERRDLLALNLGLNIVIVPGFALQADPVALATFNRAADKWEAFINDDVTVVINADLLDLGSPNIIAQAASVQPFADYDVIRAALIADAEAGDSIVNFLPTKAEVQWAFPGNFAPTGGIQATKANLKALGFQNLDVFAGIADATIQFNSTFAFDFDNSDGVGAGLIDFETVAIHELGHALGFVSEVDTVDFFNLLQQFGIQPIGIPNLITPGTMDLFRFADNVPGRDPATPADFRFVPRSLEPGVEAVMDDTVQEFRLSTGAFTGDSRQASHWKDDSFTFSTIGNLDPTIDFGTVTPISQADLWALDLIGWDINLAPTAVADNATTTQNKPVVINVLANDVDPDGTFPNNTIAIVSGPANGTAALNPATGFVTYRPAANFTGVDTFSYNVTDIEGKTTGTVNVTISVNADPGSSPPAVMPSAAFATPGIFRPETATFFLRGEQTSGAPNVGTFNFGAPGWTPIVGDFNGDGIDTVGVYDPVSANFFLNDALGGVGTVSAVNFGLPGSIPLAGDWDGDGIDTIGAFNPQTGSFFLRNTNTSGPANISFNYGAPSWTPVVGDWDGDGVDTIGVYEPVTATWFLRNSNTSGAVDVTPFSFGGSGWKPVVGDWDGEYTDTVGVWNPQTAEFYLRNTNTPGAADVTPFVYGAAGLTPLVGHWTPVPVSATLPTPTPPPAPSLPASGLSGVMPLSWRQTTIDGEQLIISPEQIARLAPIGTAIDVAPYERVAETRSPLPAERFFSAVASRAYAEFAATQLQGQVHAAHDDLAGSRAAGKIDADEVAALKPSLESFGHPLQQATDEILRRFFG